MPPPISTPKKSSKSTHQIFQLTRPFSPQSSVLINFLSFCCFSVININFDLKYDSKPYNFFWHKNINLSNFFLSSFFQLFLCHIIYQCTPTEYLQIMCQHLWEKILFFIAVDRTKSLFELLEVSKTVWFKRKYWQSAKLSLNWAKIVLQNPLKSSKKFSIFFSFQIKFFFSKLFSSCTKK